jgi:hypothetical protein
MDPVAPVAKVFEWGPNTLAAWGALLGIGFGFFLEKAGFGSAKTLAGQWYGYNFAVLRVMFTAIVVAMLGLFGLHYAGLMDLDLLYVNDTFVLPQAIGGLIFGFGFVLGEYCPGTAIVSCATGKYDAMVFLGGFFLCVVLFTLGYPAVEGLYNATSMGRVLLPGFLHVPAGVVVLAVVLMALGAFALTHVLDKKLGNKPAESGAEG